MKDKIFGVLQRVGRSFMLPIAVLPVAGLLLGIGSSFTNETTIATYGLQSILGNGTMLHALLVIISKAGNVIFDNLPIIFAVGVAIGMAKAEKEVAALSAMISFFVMHASINAVLVVSGKILADGSIADGVLDGTIASVCGIQSLQMGVFGGIIVGLGVAALHNRYHKIVLPSALSFFGGSRFVPIISTVVYVGVGILMYFIWPAVQNGIFALGGLVTGTGYFGTLVFGIIKRALIPFGLHHVFYMPFWQTAVGGTMMVDGNLVQGGQNIFFAQLASPDVTHFSAIGHVPLCKNGEEKSGWWSAVKCGAGLYVYRNYRATGIFLFICSTGIICSAGNPGRKCLHDCPCVKYRCWPDFLRRHPGSVYFRYFAGKCKDKLDADHSGGNHLLPIILLYFQFPDQKV